MSNDEIVNALRGKLPKSGVEYTDDGLPAAHCLLCKHYLNPNLCNLIAGDISPNGWCDRFTSKPYRGPY